MDWASAVWGAIVGGAVIGMILTFYFHKTKSSPPRPDDWGESDE